MWYDLGGGLIRGVKIKLRCFNRTPVDVILPALFMSFHTCLVPADIDNMAEEAHMPVQKVEEC